MDRELERAEVQDRLPDFVRGTLSRDERLMVERAVAADADLARELDAVRRARVALTPAVAALDHGRIAAALPAPMPRRALAAARWRIAAAIATIAVGGGSLAVLRNARDPGDSLMVIGGGDTNVVATTDAVPATFGYDLSAFEADELDQLITSLEQSGGLPSAEPRVTHVIPPVEEAR
jgi:hypothetical protein